MIFNLFNRNKAKGSARALNSFKEIPLQFKNEQELNAYVSNQIREMDKNFKDIDNGIDEITGTDYRTMTITDWLHSMRQADQPYTSGYVSSWVELFDIYFNMLTDPHVQGSIANLNDAVASKEFYICDEQGEKIEDVTQIFNAKWFYDFLEHMVNIPLWGFGLTQLRNFDASDLSIEVTEVNRKHVRPDLGGLTKQQYDQSVWRDWNKEPYKTWTIYTFDKKLGNLNAIVRWWIYKTEVARLWAKYNQLYGIPPVITKTAVKDKERRQNAVQMVKNWIKNRFMVIDKDDEVTQFTDKGGSQSFFENLIRLCDEQISKGILGGTMMMDAQGGQYKGDIHAENTERIVRSICRMTMFVVNKELIPRLQKIGFPIPKGARFKWDNSEKLTMQEKATVISTLSTNYDIDPETVSEFVGITVNAKEIVNDNLPPNVQGAIDDYKRRLQNEKSITEHNN